MSDLATLAEQLRATEECPVDRTANRWLGEAQAITEDLLRGDPSEEVVDDRVRKVKHLLEAVEETGDAKADDHVDRAKAAVDAILES